MCDPFAPEWKKGVVTERQPPQLCNCGGRIRANLPKPVQNTKLVLRKQSLRSPEYASESYGERLVARRRASENLPPQSMVKLAILEPL